MTKKAALPPPEMATFIRGYCPMGCGETLVVGAAGWLVCSYIPCPNPTAISDILDDHETEHIVVFEERDFTIKHPLRERLNNELLRCKLHAYCASLDGPPRELGIYRVMRRDSGGWSWSRVEE